MELNEEEKRQLFQVDGDCQAKVLDELYMTCLLYTSLYRCADAKSGSPALAQVSGGHRSGVSPPRTE